MKGIYRVAVFGVSCLGLVGLSGCPSQSVRASDELSDSFSIAADGTLTVRNLNGSIEVVAGEGDTVELDITRTVQLFYGPFVTPANPEDFLEEIVVEVSGDAANPVVEVDYPSSWARGALIATVDLVLRVPESVALDVRLRNGRVEIADVLGEIEVDANNGDVLLRGVDNSASVMLDNGAIEIRHPLVPKAATTLRAELGAGEITLALPEESAFDIEADVAVGGIDVDAFPLEVEVDVPGASVFGAVGGGGADIDLEVDLGGITLIAL